MKNLIINQLRERTCVKGKQKTWISECSDEQLYQLFQKLRSGESAKSIARYVQNVWKVNTSATIHSVSQGILKYRKRISDLLDIKLFQGSVPELPDEINEGETLHDDLLAMDRLIRLQRERIESMMKEERENGVRYPNISRDLQSLATMSKVLAKEKEFFMKHGGQDPVRQREVEMKNKRIERNFNAFMENTTKESRERIIEMADRFLLLATKHAVTMERIEDEDGNIKYSRVKEENAL